MQVWDQVKVKAAGPFEGRAGVIVRVVDGVAAVKLDEVADPPTPSAVENFAFGELDLLGR